MKVKLGFKVRFGIRKIEVDSEIKHDFSFLGKKWTVILHTKERSNVTLSLLIIPLGKSKQGRNWEGDELFTARCLFVCWALI